MAQLASMAAIAAQAAKGLGTQDTANASDPAKLTGISAQNKDPTSGTQGAQATSTQDAAANAPGISAESLEANNAGKDDDSDDPDTAAGKKNLLHKGNQLRDALKEKLAKYQALKGGGGIGSPGSRTEAEALASFEGRLGRNGSGASNGAGGTGSGSAKSDGSEQGLLGVVGSSFEAAREAMYGGGSGGGMNFGGGSNNTANTEPAFTMPASETDAAVHNMVDETGRQLASPSGILGEDSASLFERVHHVHEQCLKRGCMVAEIPSS